MGGKACFLFKSADKVCRRGEQAVKRDLLHTVVGFGQTFFCIGQSEVCQIGMWGYSGFLAEASGKVKGAERDRLCNILVGKVFPIMRLHKLFGLCDLWGDYTRFVPFLVEQREQVMDGIGNPIIRIRACRKQIKDADKILLQCRHLREVRFVLFPKQVAIGL